MDVTAALYVISVAARLVELHPTTLRKYERVGFLEPSRTPGRTRQIAHFTPTGGGRFVADRPIPVGGSWKSMVRLAKGSHLMGMPVYLPPSPQAARAGVPVGARSGFLGSDTFLRQREATGGPGWLEAVAYADL